MVQTESKSCRKFYVSRNMTNVKRSRWWLKRLPSESTSCRRANQNHKTMWLKDPYAFMGGSSARYIINPEKFGDHRRCDSCNLMFSIWHTWPHVITCWNGHVKSNLFKSPLRHHAHKFGGFRHGRSGDKTPLICRVVSQNKVNKGSCSFMSGSSSR